jgi:hypothetical protein
LADENLQAALNLDGRGARPFSSPDVLCESLNVALAKLEPESPLTFEAAVHPLSRKQRQRSFIPATMQAEQWTVTTMWTIDLSLGLPDFERCIPLRGGVCLRHR